MSGQKITADELRAILDYAPDTGIFIWKVTQGARAKAGQRAGTVHKLGYRVIGIRKTYYREHWLAWLYVHGAWPTSILDHRNRDRADNRISNLRECTYSQSCMNRRFGKPNRTGFPGVSPVRFTRSRFNARIHAGGVCHDLGNFDSPEEAYAAYLGAAERLHGEFAAHRA